MPYKSIVSRRAAVRRSYAKAHGLPLEPIVDLAMLPQAQEPAIPPESRLAWSAALGRLILISPDGAQIDVGFGDEKESRFVK